MHRVFPIQIREIGEMEPSVLASDVDKRCTKQEIFI